MAITMLLFSCWDKEVCPWWEKKEIGYQNTALSFLDNPGAYWQISELINSQIYSDCQIGTVEKSILPYR